MKRVMAAVLAAGIAAGCGDDPLTAQLLAGTYQATEFYFTPTSGSIVDVLAGGGSIDLVIAPSGAVTGQLFVPASLNGGADLTASMAGTVQVSGDAVSFTQAADTFFRDADFRFSGNRLTGTHTDGDGTMRVTLTRQ